MSSWRRNRIAFIWKKKEHGEQDSFKTLINKEIKMYPQYKKVNPDTAMPRKEPDIRSCITNIMYHTSPSYSPNQVDNEEETTNKTISRTIAESSRGITSILPAAIVTNDGTLPIR